MVLFEWILNDSVFLKYRLFLSFFSSFFICMGLLRWSINYLGSYHYVQVVREDTPKEHQKKIGIPSMGGLSMVAAIVMSYILFGDLNDSVMNVAIFCFILYAAIGLYDDFLKWTKKKGVSARFKFIAQIFVASIFILNNGQSQTLIPWLGLCTLGSIFFPWGVFIVVGSSNAFNLTDGLDGLAVMIGLTISLTLGVFAYVLFNPLSSGLDLDAYLIMNRYENIVILVSAMMGSGLSFYGYNAYPAKIFLGDVGSLSIGSLFAFLAILMQIEVYFAIAAGVIVLETLSVMVQVLSFKLRGRRIFLMAPLHHHYELLGWKETTITARFWIISVMLSMVSITLLIG